MNQPPGIIPSMTFQSLRDMATGLRSALAELEPERLSGPDAARLLEVFSEIEKLASGGRLLAARRVESSNVWRRRGHRSAAAHVAEATGTGMGPAITTLQAARQLGSLPVTEEAMREGRLSETQVKEIAGAAILQPEAEQALVETAENQPLTMLKLRCRRVKAVGQGEHGTYDAIRRGRYLRNWTDGDGAVRLDARLTPDEGARLVAAVRAESGRLAGQAQAGRGRRTPSGHRRRRPGAPGLRGRRCGAGRRPPRAWSGWAKATGRRRARVSGDGRAVLRPWSMSGWTTRPWSGATSNPVRSARSRASGRYRWRRPGAWPWTRSSACWSPTERT